MRSLASNFYAQGVLSTISRLAILSFFHRTPALSSVRICLGRRRFDLAICQSNKFIRVERVDGVISRDNVYMWNVVDMNRPESDIKDGL